MQTRLYLAFDFNIGNNAWNFPDLKNCIQDHRHQGCFDFFSRKHFTLPHDDLFNNYVQFIHVSNIPSYVPR